MRSWQALLIVSGVILDQITKYFAQTYLSFVVPKVIIPSVLSFQLVHNYGAAYGILQHQRMFLLGVSVVVIFICVVFAKAIGTSQWSRVGLAFLLIGTFGNFLDRVLLGYVVDFINIHIFPVFNIADICIDIGIACFLGDLIFMKRHEVSS